MIDPQTSVLVIGAGTFGLSTALQLLRKGHKKVTLLDPYQIPSPLSAGNDVNKIFQSTVSDKFYSDLALESLKSWREDPVYKPAFHEVGIVYGGTGDEAHKEIKQRLNRLSKSKEDVEPLNTPEEFAKYVKFKSVGGNVESQLGSLRLKEVSRFENWKGYYQKSKCGWTFAALALERAAEQCKKLGAKFIVGSAEELLFEDGKCVGVRTFSGELVKADISVICAGANSVKLLNYGGQLLAKCWTVGHIQLTDKEAESLRNSPVVLNLDEGFFFEPDLDNHLKFCNEFPGYINKDSNDISIPLYRNQIPIEAEKQMRSFLKQVFPEISERPFVVAKICWCTDTPDRHFLIGEHPDHKGLVLGTGDSGQGFKYMPIIGHYISEVVLKGDSGLDEERRAAWKWRPETAKSRDYYALQGRMGGTNVIKDLKEVEEWTDGKSKL